MWAHGLVIQPAGGLFKSHTKFFFLSDDFFLTRSYHCHILHVLFCAIFNRLGCIFTSLVAFLAAMLTPIEFAINIAFILRSLDKLDRLGAEITTSAGPGSSTSFFHRINHPCTRPSRILKNYLIRQARVGSESTCLIR